MSELREEGAAGVLGRLEGVRQDILITPAVLEYVRSHRQSAMSATEAGGQLFGTILSGRVDIIAASGPYPGDERSRYRYRSDPTAAQRVIELQSERGLIYLGEWHTHAEDQPGASSLDDDAMRKILLGSKLNTDALLMLIVGRSNGCAGLGLWTVSLSHVFHWALVPTGTMT